MRRLELHRLWRLWPVLALGLLAVSGRWLVMGRAALFDVTDRTRIFVTTPNDGGPGSLREAIFAADRADRASTIVLRTSRIVLTSELPPIVNPKGVHIDAAQSETEIDARSQTGASVLEIRSPDSLVEGLRVRGASGTALLIRAPRVRLRRLSIADSSDGVTLADGSSDVLIEDSRFEANGTGLVLDGVIPGVVVRNNQFARHEQAGIRAISPRASAAATSAGLLVRSNRFEDDRISLVLIHLGARVELNSIQRARESAMFLMGRGAIVRANRTRDSAGIGIFADDTQDALIEDNELDHHAAVALLVRSGGGTVTQNNRIYDNGYGIAVVFGDRARPHIVRGNLLMGQTQDALYVVGGSPLIERNRALRNRVAAMRILEFVPRQGPHLAAVPHLAGNVFKDNLLNGPVYGQYLVSPSEEERRK